MEVVNGYKISGNLAEIGRRYEVTDAGDAVVFVAQRKPDAIAHAEGLPAGDVEMPVFKAPPPPEKVEPAPSESPGATTDAIPLPQKPVDPPKPKASKDKLLAKDHPSKRKGK